MTPSGSRHLAIDLGASSGRIICGTLGRGGITMQEVTRFPNHPVAVGRHLYWDVLRLWDAITTGLAGVDAATSIAVDTWGVDYALLDATGQLLSQPSSYRCPRTDGVPELLWRQLSRTEHYQRTGTQYQQFNTVFQLLAAAHTTALDHADTALLIPDLITYWLSGAAHTEITNASTTGLVDPRTREYEPAVAAAVEKLTGRQPAELFAPLVEPGTVVGEHAKSSVVAVASHDTASAVLAIPSTSANPFFISCGTWSLVGVELDRAVTGDAARAENFTNELGYGRTVRFLKNIMGLWVLNEAARSWSEETIPELCAAAAELPTGRCIININDQQLFSPGDMPARIRSLAAATDQPLPSTPAEFARCIIDSLVLAYRRALRTAETLSGTTCDRVHMVGGGINNTLLCQLTADATGVPVIAGPVEGTALGNLAAQIAATTSVEADIGAIRELVARSVRTQIFHPRETQLALWERLDTNYPHED